jgi:Protein of unknown function (DUF1501)
MNKTSTNSIGCLSRREWLSRAGDGFGALALTAMLGANRSVNAAGNLSSEPDAKANSESLRPWKSIEPRAKAVIQIFCPGGLSHVDTWDYRPELERNHGKPFDAELGKQTFAGTAGNFGKSFWDFKQHGECGRWISDLFPRFAKHVDDVAFIHSMQSKSALHGPAMFMMNTGFVRPGFPSMGSWVTYGLGSETENLPAFVVLPDVRGLPPGGIINWGSGFLPAVHQGTVLETAAGKPPIANLFAKDPRPRQSEDAGRDFLQMLNRKHADVRLEDSLLEARIASFELAARMQLSAPEAVDLTQESEAITKLYEIDDPDVGPFGRQCLLARRLIERGVRFVQIYCGSENTSSKKIRPNWDSHEDIVRDHGYWGRVLDMGSNALLTDLKSRGLLDSTLVMTTSEFGRQPFMQGAQKGRDHNPGVFTAWMAGGGIRGGTSYGSSDDVGFKAAENPTYCYDLHATALHLLGIDHERLTYYNNGTPRRLTDVHGHVIRELIM